MRTLRFTAELTYDEKTMHDETVESKQWFYALLYDDDGEALILHSNKLGDEVGAVKIIGPIEVVREEK
jgi:hypothetical protein